MLHNLGEPSTSVFFFTGMFPEVPEAPSLIVLDKRTGRLIARDDEQIGPRIFHCTWSSPALGQVNGRKLVFFCSGDGVVYITTMRKLYAVQRSAQSIGQSKRCEISHPNHFTAAAKKTAKKTLLFCHLLPCYNGGS